MSKCEKDCNGSKDYSDGIFNYCLCGTRLINTSCNANITHNRTGKRPQKTIRLIAKEHGFEERTKAEKRRSFEIATSK